MGRHPLREIRLIRCPVAGEFPARGIRISTAQEAPRAPSRHHDDHETGTPVRKDGPPAARVRGA